MTVAVRPRGRCSCMSTHSMHSARRRRLPHHYRHRSVAPPPTPPRTPACSGSACAHWHARCRWAAVHAGVHPATPLYPLLLAPARADRPCVRRTTGARTIAAPCALLFLRYNFKTSSPLPICALSPPTPSSSAYSRPLIEPLSRHVLARSHYRRSSPFRPGTTLKQCLFCTLAPSASLHRQPTAPAPHAGAQLSLALAPHSL